MRREDADTPRPESNHIAPEADPSIPSLRTDPKLPAPTIQLPLCSPQTAGTEGETNKSDASVAGRDSASNVFTSVDELWAPAAAATADSSGIAAATDTNWYDVSHAHWAGVSADVSGMLGGLGGLHDVDVAASLKLIDELRAAETPLPDGVALDCGAGIGRVSSSVPTPRPTITLELSLAHNMT